MNITDFAVIAKLNSAETAALQGILSDKTIMAMAEVIAAERFRNYPAEGSEDFPENDMLAKAWFAAAYLSIGHSKEKFRQLGYPESVWRDTMSIMATFCCDWGVVGPFMAWLFYMFRDNRKSQMKAYAVICAFQVICATVFLVSKGLHWYGELWQAGMFLVIPLLLRYNGQPGSRKSVHKWIFYIIYPLHFLVFWAICR